MGQRWTASRIVAASCVVVAAASGALAVPATAQTSSTPTVASVSPRSSALTGGHRVTVSGSGFRRVSKVTFGRTAGTSIRVVSSRTLTVVAPRHGAGQVDVRVTARPKSVTRTSAVRSTDRFTYYAPPAITSVSPAVATTSGGTTVTVRGVRFYGVAQILFGSIRATVLSHTASTLTVRTPPHAAGRVALRVLGGYGSSPSTAFDYAVPPTTSASAVRLAQLGADRVSVSWVNPTHRDFRGVQIRRAIGPRPPSTVTDGDRVADVAAPGVTAIDGAEMDPGGTYSYAVFALVESGYAKPGSATLTISDWSAQRLPEGEDGIGGSGVTDVDCPDADRCVAVGSVASPVARPETSSTYESPIAATRSDGTWRTDILPVPPSTDYARLERVDCADGEHCTAIGKLRTLKGESKVLVETLVHGSWTASAFADAYGDGVNMRLNAIQCPRADRCMAVGQYATYLRGQAIVRPAAYELSAGRWASAAVPTSDADPLTLGDLRDVTCTVHGPCLAVGWEAVGERNVPSISRYADGAWRTERLAVPAGRSSTQLDRVICSSATGCRLFGGTSNPSGTTTQYSSIVVYRRGSDVDAASPDPWAIELPESAPVDGLDVHSINCPDASTCHLVGGIRDDQIVTLHDGSWSSTNRLTVPRDLADPELYAISCSAAGCLAVGDQRGSSSDATPVAFREIGARWQVETMPARNPFAALTRVSCVDVAHCTTIGERVAPDHEAEHYAVTIAGGISTRVPIPTTARTHGTRVTTQLGGLSCASAFFCAVTGDGNFRFVDDGQPFVDVRGEDGVWTLHRMDAVMLDVSCPAVGQCVAVGRPNDDDPRGSLPVAVLSGGTWTRQDLQLPDGRAGALVSVDCADAGHCTAVGYADNAESGRVTWIEELSGGTWHGSAVATPSRSTTTIPSDISCPTPDTCAIAGNYSQDGISHVFVTQRANAGWDNVTLPDYGDELPDPRGSRSVAISCGSTSTCTAIGSYLIPGAVWDMVDGAWRLRQIRVPDSDFAGEYDVDCLGTFSCVAVGFVVLGTERMPLVARRD